MGRPLGVVVVPKCKFELSLRKFSSLLLSPTLPGLGFQVTRTWRYRDAPHPGGWCCWANIEANFSGKVEGWPGGCGTTQPSLRLLHVVALPGPGGRDSVAVFSRRGTGSGYGVPVKVSYGFKLPS